MPIFFRRHQVLLVSLPHRRVLLITPVPGMFATSGFCSSAATSGHQEWLPTTSQTTQTSAPQPTTVNDYPLLAGRFSSSRSLHRRDVTMTEPRSDELRPTARPRRPLAINLKLARRRRYFTRPPMAGHDSLVKD
ncbi:uncharacterized protein J3R85_006939 [Psidium guajava]|nr:uncharacterized protein J3R85_006939 [Psidium guajava]